MVNQIPAFLAGWVFCAALLSIFHMLWRDAHRTIRYLLGGLAICAGCGIAGLILDDARLMFGPGVVASSGLIIALWTWIEERTEKGKKNAQKNGELVGITKGLTQDLIDRGGYSAEPGMDEARRRN